MQADTCLTYAEFNLNVELCANTALRRIAYSALPYKGIRFSHGAFTENFHSVFGWGDLFTSQKVESDRCSQDDYSQLPTTKASCLKPKAIFLAANAHLLAFLTV